MARDGGSSSILSSALAASSFMSSAVSMMATRQPPAPDVMPKKPASRRISLTDRTFISLPVSGLRPRLRTSRPGCDAAATWIGRRILLRNGQILGAFVGGAECQQIACHAIGECRLADARRPGDQPGLRRTTAADGARYARQRRVLPDQMRGLARMRETFDAVGLDNVFAARALGHAQSLNRLATAFQMAAATSPALGGRIDHDAAIAVASGDGEECLAQTFVKFDVEFLETGRALPHAPWSARARSRPEGPE